jgi:antitoxin VapB
MALTIDSPEAERLAQELATTTGQKVEDAVFKAVQEQTEREERRRKFHEAIKKIQDEVAKLPVLDDRSADEILGYDESGLPH